MRILEIVHEALVTESIITKRSLPVLPALTPGFTHLLPETSTIETQRSSQTKMSLTVMLITLRAPLVFRDYCST